MTRPNVLLICTDQQRYSALGAQGNTEIDTPNLDRLAARGTLFDRCYVQCTVCAPSRASLMSGQYVHSHGLHANGVAIPEHVRLLPQALHEAGYDTGLVGKWHLHACTAGRTEPAPPGMRVWQWAHDPYRGSSENRYHQWLRAAHPALYDRLVRQDGPDVGALPGSGANDFDVVPTEAHFSHWVGEETIRFITEAREPDRPFFFIANFFDPHHSFGAPKEYMDRYRHELSRPITTPDELTGKPAILAEASRETYAGVARGYVDYTPEELQDVKAAYYAMVSLVDDEVGRILAALDAEGLAQDTLVIFTSDHGEMLGDHQLMLKGPFCYDQQIRVPLILAGPGVAEGRRVADPVQWIDLTATIVELSGAELPAQQGMSLMPLCGPAAEPGAAHRGWALCEYRDSGESYDPQVHVSMLTDGKWKLAVHHGSPATARERTGELYDLTADPDELINRWDDPACAGTRAELTALLLDVLVATENRSQPREASW